MPIHSRRRALLTLFALLFGCGKEAGVPGAVRPTELRRVAETIEVRTLLESTPDLQPADVRGALVAPNGEIAVVDVESHQVLILDSAVDFVRRIGHRGSGPGEFEGVELVAYWGDSLAAYDMNQRRLSLLRRDGSLIRQERIEVAGTMGATVIGIRPDGALILRGILLGSSSPTGEAMPMRGVVVAVKGERADTIARFNDGLWHPRGPRWFAWRAAVAMTDSGVWIGEGGRPELRFIAWDGRTTAVLHWEARTRAVGQADRAKIVAMAAGRNGSPDLTAPDRFADSIPYFARLLTDAEGGAWLIAASAPFESPDSAWRVDPKMGTIAGMALPPQFRPTDAGENGLMGLQVNDDGGTRIVRVRVSQ